MGTFIPILEKFELELLAKHSKEIKSRKNPLIAISGFSGVGKDTIALIVQNYFEKQGYDLKISGAGDFVRKIAVESGYSEKDLDKFMKFVKEEQNEEFAQKVDLEIEKHALKQGLLEGGIFVGRMATFAIGEWGLTLWITTSAEVIAERISSDKNRAEYGLDKEEIIKRVKLRDITDRNRLEQIYNVSFKLSLPKFDLIIENERKNKEELKNWIYKLLKEKFTDSKS